MENIYCIYIFIYIYIFNFYVCHVVPHVLLVLHTVRLLYTIFVPLRNTWYLVGLRRRGTVCNNPLGIDVHALDRCR